MSIELKIVERKKIFKHLGETKLEEQTTELGERLKELDKLEKEKTVLFGEQRDEKYVLSELLGDLEEERIEREISKDKQENN